MQVSTNRLCINIYYTFCVVFVISDALFFVLRVIMCFCDFSTLRWRFCYLWFTKRTISILCGPDFSPLLWHVCIYVWVRMRVCMLVAVAVALSRQAVRWLGQYILGG